MVFLFDFRADFTFVVMSYSLLGIVIGLFAVSDGTVVGKIRKIFMWLLLSVFLGAVLPWLILSAVYGVDTLFSAISFDFFNDSVGAFLVFCPFLFLWLVIYQPFGAPSWIRGAVLVYIIFWLVGLLLVGIAQMVIPAMQTYNSVGAGESAAAVLQDMWDNVPLIWERLQDGFSRSVQLADPNYYISQVEDNKEVQNIGVRLEDVDSLDPFYTPEQTPIVRGYITANSFLEEKTDVVQMCTITAGSEAIGIPDRASYEVFFGSDEYFECEFPAGLAARNYPVEVSSTFEFETWAYLPYEFVLDEKIREYARLQQDIFVILDIDREPIATFTDGPVALGIGGSRNPIAVYTEEPYLRNTRIGFSVTSNWPRGEIQEVRALTLSLPNGFTIEECNRPGLIEGPFPDENVLDAQGNPIYNRYEFRNAEGPANAFTGITCDLNLESLEDLPELIGSDKATRSFVALAEYTYTVSERSQFRVRE